MKPGLKGRMIVITALAIALSCYVSDNAMHRKRQILTLREPKPLNRFWSNLAGLTMSGTPHHITILVGVALRGWSEYIRDLSNLGVSFLFFFYLFLLFFFSFLFSFPHAQVTFIDQSGRCICQNACSGQGCAFWNLDNIWLHLGG